MLQSVAMPRRGQAPRGGQIILFNGASSAGKTTLAKALQTTLEQPYYLVQLDAFEDMIPSRLSTGTAEEIEAQTLSARAMHGTVATLSRAGANVIADHVFLDVPGFDTWLEDCVQVLRDLPVLFVGVHCPLPVLERREMARGDRDVGQARWQFPRVHGHGAYDVEVDTNASSVQACVDAVRNGLPRSGRAFEALRRRFVERG